MELVSLVWWRMVMTTLLKYEKKGKQVTKSFNSYYLAIVEKNKLISKGLKVVLEEEPIELRDDRTINSDSKLRTVYNKRDKDILKKIQSKYEPVFKEKKET